MNIEQRPVLISPKRNPFEIDFNFDFEDPNSKSPYDMNRSPSLFDSSFNEIYINEASQKEKNFYKASPIRKINNIFSMEGDDKKEEELIYHVQDTNQNTGKEEIKENTKTIERKEIFKIKKEEKKEIKFNTSIEKDSETNEKEEDFTSKIESKDIKKKTQNRLDYILKKLKSNIVSHYVKKLNKNIKKNIPGKVELPENGKIISVVLLKPSYKNFTSVIKYEQNRKWMNVKMLHILIEFGDKKKNSNRNILDLIKKMDKMDEEMEGLLNKTFREIIEDYREVDSKGAKVFFEAMEYRKGQKMRKINQ